MKLISYRAGERPGALAGKSDYYTLLARARANKQHTPYEVWFFDFRDRLPTIAVPLQPSFDDVPLNLQSAFDLTYERARYHGIVDYTCEVPLPEIERRCRMVSGACAGMDDCTRRLVFSHPNILQGGNDHGNQSNGESKNGYQGESRAQIRSTQNKGSGKTQGVIGKRQRHKSRPLEIENSQRYSEYIMYLDETLTPPAILCVVGKTEYAL